MSMIALLRTQATERNYADDIELQGTSEWKWYEKAIQLYDS
jgi:hypothetical protein